MDTVKSFLFGTVEEFKRVQWPEKNQAYRLTIYVVGASLIVGLFVSAFDYLFKEVLTLILR